MYASLQPEKQADDRKVYRVRANVVDINPPFAALDIKGRGGSSVCLSFDSLEEVAAFGRAIEREAEVCMAERDAQAQEVA